MTRYALRDAARILKLPPARLRYWERSGLLESSARDAPPRLYAFRDLVMIKAIVALLERGVPLRRIRRSLDRIRERMPEVEEPVGALRVWLEGSDRVVVKHEAGLIQPDGQMVIDFELAPASADDVAPLPVRGAAGPPDPALALEWFERALALDGDPATYVDAVECYRRAIDLDPEFADAHCNLGAVYYNQNRRREARACYERALVLEAGHLEANFNLANLLEDEGQNESALRHFKAALEADPLYPDAHLNTALLYDKLGLRRRGREHWRRYLQLMPDGPWTEVARQRLKD